MGMKYNTNGISIREGKIFIDGLECADNVKCDIHFTPEVWKGKLLGEQSDSSRWIGYSITGSITRRRSTAWLKEAILKYKNGKATPEFTIQGIMNDENSDYYETYGSETVTAVGCVLTGDLSLISLDSGGEILDDNISFNARDIV